MQLKNLILGIIITTLLVLALGVTRLMKMESAEEVLELTRIDPLTLTPPPEPFVEEPAEEVEELDSMEPPPAAAMDLRPSVDMQTLAIPVASVSISPDVEVDLFSEDVAPPSLPVVKAPAPKNPKVKPTSKKPVVAKVTKRKVAIGIGDLDSKPKNLRVGRFRWPSSVRDSQVKAMVIVELDQRGHARLVRIQSVSHPAFRKILPKLVNASRFTVPKHKGKAVKVTYPWPITLQKP